MLHPNSYYGSSGVQYLIVVRFLTGGGLYRYFTQTPTTRKKTHTRNRMNNANHCRVKRNYCRIANVAQALRYTVGQKKSPPPPSDGDSSHGTTLGREAWPHKRRALHSRQVGWRIRTIRYSHNGAYLDVLAESLAAVTVALHTASSSAPSTGAVQDPRVSQVRPFAEVSTKRLFSLLTNKRSSRNRNK